MLLGTTTDNTVDKLQIDGSLIATAIKKTGGTSSQFLKADGSVDSTAYGTGSVTSVSATVPTGFAISGSPITTSGTLAITFASGYALPTTIKQSNWDDAYTFVAAFPTQTGNAGKYLTTDGSSLSWGTIVSGVSSFNTRTGDVTLVSTDVINALNYTPVTNARTLTINGTTYDLSADRSWTIASGVSSFNTRTGDVTLTSSDVTTALGFTPVTQARSLSINGQAYDLSADRSWTITAGSGMRNVTHYTATANQTTFTITGGYTVGLLDVFLNGVRIPESDFTATNGTTVVFNEGVKALDIITAVLYTASATSGITGAGTANYLAKWSGTSAITNSVIQDNGSLVSIGTSTSISGSLTVTRGSFNPSLIAIGSNAGNGQIQISNSSNYIIGAGTDYGGMSFTVGGSEKFNITNSGTSTFIGPALAMAIASVNSTELYCEYRYNTSTVVGYVGNGTGISSGGANGDFGIRATNNLIFTSGGSSERMRITSAGNLGIGASSPATKLEVAGSVRAYLNSLTQTELFAENSAVKIRLIAGQSSSFVSTTTNHPLIFETNNSERMRITNGGSIQIGSSTGAGAKIFVYDNRTNSSSVDEAALYIRQDGTNAIQSWASSGGNERMRLTPTGNLLMGTTNESGLAKMISLNDPSNCGIKLLQANTVRGYLYVYNNEFYLESASSSRIRVWVNSANGVYMDAGSTSWTSNSDERLKTDLNPITNALEKVSKLRSVIGRFKADDKSVKRSFLIAQDVQLVLPEAVSVDDKTGYLGVQYTEVIPLLVASTKELIYNFETQAEKIARLETRVQQLEAK
jgi:hypothetical protein